MHSRVFVNFAAGILIILCLLALLLIGTSATPAAEGQPDNNIHRQTGEPASQGLVLPQPLETGAIMPPTQSG